ncbi:MAG: HAMP domain-containing sensor histidine kinase [Terriglobales bacterium]|jgi:signal transduction histidine kinase
MAMSSLRLRTKFLLTVTLVTASLTATTLLLVRRSVQQKVRQQIFRDLENSVLTFRNFQRQRQAAFSESAELLADLPNVRALMTTRDASTIQDASLDLWRLARTDLFVLADPSAKIMALHASSPGLTAEDARDFMSQSLGASESSHWWYASGHLYEVFVQPIYFGDPAEERRLGYLALGYEVNGRIAEEISRVSASQVVFTFEGKIVTSTLSSARQNELLASDFPGRLAEQPGQIRLDNESFLVSSVDLAPEISGTVRLTVLKSLDRETQFLSGLNRELLALGLIAVLGGSFFVFLISKTFTRPLENLVAGVRALEQGNFAYPLAPHGRDEVAEVAVAFDGMRSSLHKTQRELVDAERLATIGRMASSISHDLRHSLAAIVANAEFLCEGDLSPAQREELYQEVRVAVNQMTDLIEALLEFSRTRESLRPAYGSIQQILQRMIQVVKAHPDFHDVTMELFCEGNSEGWFDAKRLERVFHNLLLNACEAVPRAGGKIQIRLRQTPENIEVKISDNGRGIADVVRNTLFEPFVSHDKENGTGLGLTVVQKIVQDHGGEIVVENTSSAGTVFRLTLPLRLPVDKALSVSG